MKGLFFKKGGKGFEIISEPFQTSQDELTGYSEDYVYARCCETHRVNCFNIKMNVKVVEDSYDKLNIKD